MISTGARSHPRPPRRARERCSASPYGRRSATPATNRRHRTTGGSRAPLTATHSTRSFIARPPVPVTVKQRGEHGNETDQAQIYFRNASVFDVSQTDPLPGAQAVPLTPPAQPITGDSHAHLIAPLTQLAGELGYKVEIRDLPEPGPRGWCDHQRKQIVIATGPANRHVRTLLHELAHALGVGYQQYGRERAEVLIDCVTYIACSSLGLDVSGEAIPYVAGWGEQGALDALRAYAERIDAIARRIEHAADPDAKPANVDETITAEAT